MFVCPAAPEPAFVRLGVLFSGFSPDVEAAEAPAAAADLSLVSELSFRFVAGAEPEDAVMLPPGCWPSSP